MAHAAKPVDNRAAALYNNRGDLIMICEICGSELPAKEEAAGFCERCGSKTAPAANFETGGEEGYEAAGNYYYVGAQNPGGGIKAGKPKIFFLPARAAAVSLVIVIFAACGILFALNQNTDGGGYPKINVIAETALDFEYVSFFSEGLALVMAGNNANSGRFNWKYGYIDMTGELVIPVQYDYAMDFSEGLAAVYMQKNGGWGFIGKTGELAVPFMYEQASPFCEGLAAVSKDGKWGYIDAAGGIAVPFEYRQAYSFIDGLSAVMIEYNPSNSKWGIIDKNGGTAVPFEYDHIYFNEFTGFYHVNKDSKQGLMDASGSLIVPCAYDQINFNPADGLLYVQQQKKWKILEIEGCEPDPNKRYPQYHYAGPWSSWSGMLR